MERRDETGARTRLRMVRIIMRSFPYLPPMLISAGSLEFPQLVQGSIQGGHLDDILDHSSAATPLQTRSLGHGVHDDVDTVRIDGRGGVEKI